VTRRHRAEYLQSLDLATDGNLKPLVRLFARLEGVALRSELIRPMAAAPETTSVVDVARAYTDRLLQLRQQADGDKRQSVLALADAVHRRLGRHLATLRTELVGTFTAVDPRATGDVLQSNPGDERAHWWRAQLVDTANAVDFFTNLNDGSWWTRFKIQVFGERLCYVVAVQRMGRGESGFLAVTAFAEMRSGDHDARPVSLLDLTADDAVTLVYSDDDAARWPAVSDLVDRTLTAAVTRFAQTLG